MPERGFVHDRESGPEEAVESEALQAEAAKDRTQWLRSPEGPSVTGDSSGGMESEGSHLWRNRSHFSQEEGSP